MRPAPAVAGRRPYRVPPCPQPIPLDLRGNEGARVDFAALPPPAAHHLRAYPDARPLEAAIARRWGLDPAQVVATAGADDALDRLCRALVGPGDAVLLPTPTFEMTERYAAATGATVVRVPWDRIAAPTLPSPALVVVTTPNNPTGAVCPWPTIEALARSLPDAVVAVDLAYVEYADDDPTTRALALPNVVVIRTFSKAWGLAGLRVGWAAGPPEVISWLRAAGAPYPTSAWSLDVALARLQVGVPADHVERVRVEREQIHDALVAGGVAAVPSGANFVFGRCPDAAWLHDGLAGLGIGVRTFPDRPGLEDAVRIGCPSDPDALARLVAGIGAVTRPEALLLDVDGVLLDVTDSYDEAIVQTCAAFGATVDRAQIGALKALGGANDDWDVTWRLLDRRVPFEDVKATFERLYQGGLWRRERVLVRRLPRLPVALVTGRPRRDLERSLAHFGLSFPVAVCREDGPLKPDPWPVAEALRRLGVGRAWMIGDTVDDVRAARAAGVVPLGVGDEALLAAGAARVHTDVNALLELLP